MDMLFCKPKFGLFSSICIRLEGYIGQAHVHIFWGSIFCYLLSFLFHFEIIVNIFPDISVFRFKYNSAWFFGMFFGYFNFKSLNFHRFFIIVENLAIFEAHHCICINWRCYMFVDVIFGILWI